MNITYGSAGTEDIAPLYALCRQLIEDYENLELIDLDNVLGWVRRKLETCITDYTVIYADGIKAGYYHFYTNADGKFELDDLYIFPEFQGRGIGSMAIGKCCASVNEPVMLYVFAKNQRAVSLYQRLGFSIVKTINDSRYIMERN